jgi:hypothetical protein
MKLSRTYLLMLLAFFFAVSATLLPALKAAAATQDNIVIAADDDWDDWDEEEEEDAFGNIMHTTYLTIKSVTVDTSGAVSAEFDIVGAEDEEGEVTVASAKAIYAINGDLKGKKSVDLACTGTKCTGKIDAKSGDKVTVAISAADNFGNTTTQAFKVKDAASAKDAMVSGTADMDNSVDIVPDDMDILDTMAAYDDERVYVAYTVQGIFNGGTLEPPYVHFYGVKMTNPDIEQSEGLMVGKLWVNLPLARTPEGQELIAGLLGQVGSLPEGVNQADVDNAMKTGMLVLDIGKLMSGNIMDGLLFQAQPMGNQEGNMFLGSIKRSALGENPSNMIRIIVLTAANASIDSFMPIPLNCSHYQQLVFGNTEVTIK